MRLIPAVPGQGVSKLQKIPLPMLRQGSFLFRPQGSFLFRPKGSVPRARRGQSHAPFPPRQEGYVKALILGGHGEIMPLAVGGGTTSYFCDYFYTNIPASGSATRGVLFGGDANHGANAGFVCASTSNAPSYTSAYFGSRLCFYPIDTAA